MVRNICKGWQRAGKTHGAWVSKSKSRRRARGDKGRRIEAGCRHTSLPRAGKASMAMPSIL